MEKENTVEITGTEKENEKTYTLDDLKKNGSQAAKNAVDEYKKNQQPEAIEAAVKAALEEKQQEQNMTAQQLADKKAQQREAELDKREAKLNATEQRNLAVSILSENNLSTDFAQYLVGKDDDETKAKVSAYVNSVKADVDTKVNEYAKGKQVPPAGADKLNHSDAHKDFKDMSFEEKIALHHENPAKYEELKKGAR